jgi:precorrin-6B methylase 2
MPRGEQFKKRPGGSALTNLSTPGFRPASCAAWDPMAAALLEAKDHEVLGVRHTDGRVQPLPLRDLRRLDGFSDLELVALEHARSPVLDLGCGAGPHAVELARRGHLVCALDRALGAALATRRALRGPGGAHNLPDASGESQSSPRQAFAAAATLDAVRPRAFRSILLLMNGLGLAGTYRNAPGFLAAAAQKLLPGGALLVESCDLECTDVDEELRLIEARRSAGAHPGESVQQISWRESVGQPFPWLYLSSGDLAAAAAQAGLHCQVLFEEGEGGYLARLSPL